MYNKSGGLDRKHMTKPFLTVKYCLHCSNIVVHTRKVIFTNQSSAKENTSSLNFFFVFLSFLCVVCFLNCCKYKFEVSFEVILHIFT